MIQPIIELNCLWRLRLAGRASPTQCQIELTNGRRNRVRDGSSEAICARLQGPV